MATQDTTEDKSEETLENEDIETSNEEDETSQEDDNKDESEETEDSDEEDSTEDEEDSEEDDDSETEDEDSKFEKRFTQFKGDSYEEYVPNLEKAYGELLGEMTRVKQSAKDDANQMDVIRQAIQKDPDFAKKLDELLDGKTAEVTVDPAIQKVRDDYEANMTKEYNEFVEAHPEMESDPTVTEAVLGTMQRLGKIAREEKKPLSMKDALNQAWIINGYNATDEKEQIASKAKESASKSKTGNKAKKTTSQSKDGKKYTAEQLAYAKKWGVELE